MGSQKMNIFQKADRDDFHKEITGNNYKKEEEGRPALMGAPLGSQCILSGSSAGTQ